MSILLHFKNNVLIIQVIKHENKPSQSCSVMYDAVVFRDIHMIISGITKSLTSLEYHF